MQDDSRSLSGQIALVTGASSGLGPTICRALDAAGAKVALHYHQNQAGADQLAAELNQACCTIQADLIDSASVTSLFQQAADSLGPITLLVNCAAAESQLVSPLKDIDVERWAATQRTNVDAPLILTQLMAAQGGSGAIINISSIEGSRPALGHSHYSTSKAALDMLTKASALELGPQGIRVNAIAPGLIWRDGIDEGWPEGVASWKAAAPLGRLVDPKNIAATVVFLASNDAASITGITLNIDAGMSIQPSW